MANRENPELKDVPKFELAVCVYIGILSFWPSTSNPSPLYWLSCLFSSLSFNSYTIYKKHSKWDGILPVSIAPGLKDFSVDGQLVENLKAHIEANESPILLQPEETTSGKNCLLKFNTNVAEVSTRVQPVAVIAERPQWANTAVTVLGASATCDLFWFLFSPYTQFKLKYLSVLQREKEETPEAFTERIRNAIANALGYKTSSFTAHDKAEYEKRYLDELNRPVFVSNSRAPSPEILRMSLQVSEVLPYVPREAIIRDLSRTRSIDMTISNILEGAVQYTPVTPGQSRPTLHHSSVAREPTFSKSSSERMSSFMERKAKMIAEARKRYIEKKGLKGLV